MPDSSGNPVSSYATDAFADDGNRALYGIAGGTPIGPSGTITSIYLSERTRERLAAQTSASCLSASS